MTDQQGTALPWKQRISMLSINPDAATRDDVASLAEELMIANHKAARAEEAERWVVKLEDALDRIDHELGRPDGLKIPAPVCNASHIAREALAECVLWRKSRE